MCDSKTAAFLVLVHRLALVFSALLQGCDRCDSKKTTLLGVYIRAREGGVREIRTSKSNAKHKQARPLAFRSTKSYFCKVHLSLPAGRKNFPHFSAIFSHFRHFSKGTLIGGARKAKKSIDQQKQTRKQKRNIMQTHQLTKTVQSEKQKERLQQHNVMLQPLRENETSYRLESCVLLNL